MSERATPRRVAAAVALIANCYPLVGVLSFDWTVATVLVLYWVEMGVAAAWGIPKALLAVPRDRALTESALPLAGLREKRGGWTVRGHTVYLRNVPTALLQLSMLGVVWVGIGAYFGFALDLWGEVTPAHWRTVAVGALGMAVAAGVSFLREYVGEREYERVSARMAIAHTAQQTLAVLLLAFLVAASEGFREAGLAVVAGVVVAKTAAETYGRFTDGPGESALAALLGTRDTAVAAPFVPVPDGDPDARRRPDPRAVRVECVLRGLGTLASRPGVLCALATGFLAAFVDPLLALVPGALLVAGVCLGAVGRYLHLGSMEYRRYGDVLVGHDRLLGEPQWRAPLDACDASIPRRLTDRYADTAVVTLDWSDPDDAAFFAADYDPERTRASVGPFAEFGAAVAALDLPVSPAERPTPDRTVAGATFALVAAFATVPLLVWRASHAGHAVIVAFLLLLVVAPLVVVAVYYL